MTDPVSLGVTWYFNTAGIGEGDGYRWLSYETHHDPSAADFVLMAPVAGLTLVELTAERNPSIVLARNHDSRFVFYATRLVPPGVPEEGDIKNRRISASVLGVATADGGHGPLVDAAVSALEGDLARSLPLNWTAGSPAVDHQSSSWPMTRDGTASRPQTAGHRPQSVRLPPTSRSIAATALASLSAIDLDDLPPDQILLLDNDALGLEELDRLRPWWAITPLVKEQVTIAGNSKSGDWRQLALVLGLAAFAALVAILLWAFL